MNNRQSEMEQMLKDISILDFTLVDFTEYLDTPILTITIKSVWT